MFSLLPDLTPRDSHSLWYTSPRNPFAAGVPNDTLLNNPHEHHLNSGTSHHQHGANSHRRGAQLIERSPLARLRADEQNVERRRQNVTNFGSTWLKPPGLPKTLHQLREERREAEEHQEALRREQLAQELQEAEAAEAAAAAGGDPADIDAVLDDALQGSAADDDGMDDVQLDGARDLDDDIPEAGDFGLSVDDEDEDEEDDDDDDVDPEEREMRAAHAQQQQLMAQRMRHANDAFREDLARGRDSTGFYGVEEIDDEDQSQMLEEEDLVGNGDDMGMGANLDDDVPEAESFGGYEHTDTEAELSSSADEYDNEHSRAETSFAGQQQPSRSRHSLARTDGTRNSMAISDILSRDGSSVLGSSPQVPRQRFSRQGRG
ncbi:Apc15p protein-domain-containing protein [Xylariaceae sp. FL1272]|nr:Apc15p protein-domain-containing protein [Xylariaceae sp. FL1272]